MLKIYTKKWTMRNPKIYTNNNTLIKFCVKIKKTVIKEKIDAAYNESAIWKASIYHWYNKFKSDRKRAKLTGDLQTQNSVTEQTINIHATMILDDPHLTVRQHASLLDFSIESVYTFLSTKLGLPYARTRWILHLLSRQQKTFVLKVANIR